jgi:hypothetical protein
VWITLIKLLSAPLQHSKLSPVFTRVKGNTGV